MPALTDDGRARVAEVANRHGVSQATAEALLDALARGGGSQAQFSIPELGGMGQWSRGGMTMVGDMFNNALKARVDGLCNDLSYLIGQPGIFAPMASGFSGGGYSGGGYSGDWPAGLGQASSAGSQNDMRYAVFPTTRRLAVSRGGVVTVYDTGDHMIGGVSQAQSGDQSLSFSSQRGTVRLSDLAVVSPEGNAPAPVPGPQPQAAPAPDVARAAAQAPASHVAPDPVATPAPDAPAGSFAAAAPAGDIISMIERLAELKARGVLTDEEFAAKKADLLSRL